MEPNVADLHAKNACDAILYKCTLPSRHKKPVFKLISRGPFPFSKRLR